MKPKDAVRDFKVAGNAREVESKFLSKLQPSQALGHGILSHFCIGLGCEGYSNPTRTILTYQFDNDDNELLKNGITLRTRSNLDACGNPTDIDICIKVNTPKGSNSFLERGEYEAPMSGPLDQPDFNPLLNKYPPSSNPEFQHIISCIKAACPELKIVMPVERSRHVLAIPGYFFDIYDPEKKAVIELNDDRIRFGVKVPLTTQEIFFAEDREIEFELLHKACTYDRDPRRELFISSNFTPEETARLFGFVNDTISGPALHGLVAPNDQSKAHRGFSYREDFMQSLEESYTCMKHAGSPQQRETMLAYLLGSRKSPADAISQYLN